MFVLLSGGGGGCTVIQVFIGGSPIDFDNVHFYCQRGPSSGALKYELHAWNPPMMELLCRRLPLGQALTLSFIEASYVFELLRGTRNVKAERRDAAYLANSIEEFCMAPERVYIRGLVSIRAP